MWFMRLVPITRRRIRFALSQADVVYPPSADLKKKIVDIPERGVRGIFLPTASPDVEEPPVLFWCFGGAFVAGSATSNVGLAERYARRLSCDVFLPELRLCPENKIEEVYTDACRAYEWLVSTRSPNKIVVFGFSSGGGTALRVLQLARDSQDGPSPFFFGTDPVPQPGGGVLLGAFVNYVDGDNSLVHHQPVDWLVTQRLYEFIHPQIGTMCGGEERRRDVSSSHQPMHGLCPICVHVSEHDVCYDENVQLVQDLRKAGNLVQIYTRPYLCHAYQLFARFLPEGQKAEDEIISWILQVPAWRK